VPTKKLTRADYVRLIEKKYLASVMKDDYATIRDCFTEDARATIYHGDNPVQVFFKNPKGRQQSFDTFYGHLFANYTTNFGTIHTVVDADTGTAATTYFGHRLTVKKGSPYKSSGNMRLNNANFFWFRRGKIADMIIYYANPTFGKKMGLKPKMPTAFPK
jgi:hypothetical protein